MKASELKKQLSKVLTLAKSKSDLPILEYIKVDGDTFISTNLEIEISQAVKSVNKSNEPYLIPAKQLDKILTKLKSNKVELSNDGKKAILKTDKGKFEFVGDDVKEFPVFEMGEQDENVSIEYGNLLNKAFNFTSQNELTPKLCGVYISPNGICASNGHYLIWSDFETGFNSDFILPNAVSKYIKGENNIHIVLHKYAKGKIYKKIKLSFSDTVIKCREIDDLFVKYKEVIPETNQFNFSMDKKEFLNQLDLAGITANQTTNRVDLLEGGKLESYDIDEGTHYNTNLECETNSTIDIGFNYKFMQLILNNTENEFVTIEYSESNRPMIIRDNKINFLLMPVKIEQYA